MTWNHWGAVLLAGILSLSCGPAHTSAIQSTDVVVPLAAPSQPVSALPAPATVTPIAEYREPEPEVRVVAPTASTTPVVVVEADQETVLEAAILDQAISGCAGAKVGTFDRRLLRDLLRIETRYKVPAQLRGMVLAAACEESGFNPAAGGDHKFSKNGKTPVAIGIVQQWPWWEVPLAKGGYGIDRKDPHQAVNAWLAHIAKQVPRAQRNCRFTPNQKVDLTWRTAWITGVNAPSPTPRCTQTFSHWETFVKWRAAWSHLLPSKPSSMVADQTTYPHLP